MLTDDWDKLTPEERFEKRFEVWSRRKAKTGERCKTDTARRPNHRPEARP